MLLLKIRLKRLCNLRLTSQEYLQWRYQHCSVYQIGTTFYPMYKGRHLQHQGIRVVVRDTKVGLDSAPVIYCSSMDAAWYVLNTFLDQDRMKMVVCYHKHAVFNS